MENEIIGRTEEQAELCDIFNSNKAEFLAIIGRRRVGKTFLISIEMMVRLLYVKLNIPLIRLLLIKNVQKIYFKKKKFL